MKNDVFMKKKSGTTNAFFENTRNKLEEIAKGACWGHHNLHLFVFVLVFAHTRGPAKAGGKKKVGTSITGEGPFSVARGEGWRATEFVQHKPNEVTEETRTTDDVHGHEEEEKEKEGGGEGKMMGKKEIEGK